MSDLERRACGQRSAPDASDGDVPLAPLHDVPRRRTGRHGCSSRGRSDEIVTALRLAHAAGVPVTLLGGGSNVLVPIAACAGSSSGRAAATIAAARPTERVRADAAVTINGLVRWTIITAARASKRGPARRERSAAPIFGNAHFGGRLIGELVVEVRLAARDGDDERCVRRRRWSSATIAAACRTPAKCCCRRRSACRPAIRRRCARRRAQSLAYRKRTQPLDTPSAGCIFQNPDRAATSCPTGSRGRPARWSIGPG